MNFDNFFSIEEDFVVVKLNKAIYDLDLVFSASYQLLANCFVILDKGENSSIIVKLSYMDTNKITKESLRVLAIEFYNSLVNYKFYKLNSTEKEKTRSLVLAKSLGYEVEANSTFSDNSCVTDSANSFEASQQSDLLDLDDIDDDDFEFEDPEGIAVPWEEKHGSKKSESEVSEKSFDNINKSEESDSAKLGDNDFEFEDLEGSAVPWEENLVKEDSDESKNDDGGKVSEEIDELDKKREDLA